MKTLIVTPSAASTLGNSITAERWAQILRTLGHQVSIVMTWTGEVCDVLIGLHARRSHASIKRFRHANPNRPLIVALTGTDLYRDLCVGSEAHDSLSMATTIVALQSGALDELDAELRSKTRVIYQSATPPIHRDSSRDDCFEVCVLSHLRDVKDPLRPALAARRLPDESRIRIIHAGRALEPHWLEIAKTEEVSNPRYRWIGELSHDSALQLLARCRLLVLSSTIEGGANAIAEAVACGVPLVCSEIPGNKGMLGADYPGYFSVGETEQLARMLWRAEADAEFLARLREYIRALQPRFTPEQELASWDQLLKTLGA